MENFAALQITMMFILLVVSIAGPFVYLLRLNRQTSLRCQDLLEIVRRQENDLTGLSLAGVNIDRLLMDHDKRLGDHQERVETLKTQEFADQPYQRAIERIRAGASAADLVTELGLSLSEAGLLVRLHAASQQERSR
jgi:hypothetical protein